jgi:hypothetical protein
MVAFIAAGVRPPTPLAKAISLVLAIKLAAIAILGVVVFASGGGPAVDASAVSRMMGPYASPEKTAR